MNETVGQPAPASRVVDSPTPQNRESWTIRQLADAYLAQYAGRDNARPARVLWWCDGCGDYGTFRSAVLARRPMSRIC